MLGLLLLGWLFSYMRRPDWDDGPVEALVSVYFAAFPGFAGYLINIGVVTLIYALMAFCVYTGHAGRMRAIGLAVKSCVYSCIVCVVFLSLNFTLVLLDLQRWEPFAQSVCLVTCALFCSMGLIHA